VPAKGVSHTAVLHKGKVYKGGGNEPGFTASHRIDVYTLSNNSWSPSPINSPYNQIAMTTLGNQLITVGGKNKSYIVTNKILSLDGNQLKEYTRMITPRCFASAAGYRGTLIIAGGKTDWRIRLATTELFDSVTQQWYNASNLPSPHYGGQPVIVDNVVYLLGGSQFSTKVFSAPLDYLTTHKLKWGTQQNTPWYYTTPVSIQSKHLLTIGGYRDGVYTRDIYIFNKVSNSWEVVGQIPSARSGPAVVSVANNKIVIVGGNNDKLQKTNTVWIGSCESQ